MKSFLNKKFIKKNIIAIVALVEVLLISVVSVLAWTETISSLKILTQKDGVIDTGINNTAKIDESITALNLDSYFSKSGNVHLASCSSPNGKDFYFPIKKTTSTNSALKYRKNNINDKNVNYLSFSLQVKADSADRTFYFRQSPTIKINGTAVSNTDTSLRMAFYLNDENKGVFAKSSAQATPINSTSGDTTDLTVNSFGNYTIGKNSIFSVSSGKTATLTVSLWLEDPACKITSGVVSVEGLELITTAQQTTRITFVDKTSAFNDQNNASTNSWHWVKNDGACVWLYDGTTSYKMTKNGDSDEWIANLRSGSYTTNTAIVFYRTSSTVTNPVTDAADKTKVFNKWSTKYQTDSATYTAFGSKYNASGDCRGTWDSVTEITLNAENTTTAKAVLPIPSTTATNKAAHIKVLYKSGTSDIGVEMSYENGFWRCFIPSTVNQLGFSAENATGSDTSTLKQTSTALTRNNETSYTVTSQNTGYWGAGVLVKATVDDSCKDFGTVDVKIGSNSVNGLKVTKGTKVTFTATPKTDYQFKQWKDGTTVNTNSTAEVTANADLNYVAYFIDNYKLTLHSRVVGAATDSTTGGTVKLTSGGTAGSTAVYKAKGGTKVTLTSVFTATPNTHYEIDGWYDANGNKVTTVTLNSDTDVYVRFTYKTYKITAHSQVEGQTTDSTTGGTVKLKSGTAGSSASYSATYNNTFTLNDAFDVVPDQNYEFVNWYDKNGNVVKGDTEIKVSGDLNYYAKFKQTKVTVYFNKNNNSAWNGTINYYVWDANENHEKAWPGNPTTEVKIGNTTYNSAQFDLSKNYKYIIFNSNGNPQTVDIEIPTNSGYVVCKLNSSKDGNNYKVDKSTNKPS